MAAAEECNEAFVEFLENLDYSRRLIEGGRRLGELKVGAFDVEDLYRAAWVQAVAALDHWVTRELVERGLALALRPEADRPPKFGRLTVSMELFERVHHRGGSLAEAFRERLEKEWAYQSFQQPKKIEDAFAQVSTVRLWPRVAGVLSRAGQAAVTADEVRGRLQRIADRRNRIAHTADRDRESPTGRRPLTADEAAETVEWLTRIGGAMSDALGPVPVADYDSPPEDVGEPVLLRSGRSPSHWDEASVLEAIDAYCPPEVAATLLAVYRHAESHPAFARFYYGQAAYPSVTAWFEIGDDQAAAWSIYTGEKKTVLSINFQWMRDRGVPADRMDPLVESLSALPGWTHVPGTVRASAYGRRPALEPKALAEPAAAKTITDAFDVLLASSRHGAEGEGELLRVPGRA